MNSKRKHRIYEALVSHVAKNGIAKGELEDTEATRAFTKKLAFEG